MILAYLDPGSGSLILQAVLGGAAGLGVAAKAMRSRLKNRKLAAADEQQPAEVEPDPVETSES